MVYTTLRIDSEYVHLVLSNIASVTFHTIQHTNNTMLVGYKTDNVSLGFIRPYPPPHPFYVQYLQIGKFN